MEDGNPIGHPRSSILHPRLLPPVAVAALTVFVVARTWGTWPDPVIDFGSQLYYAWRLAAGQRLYADVANFNGPLSQWINGALFRLFGVGLSTLVWFNLLVLSAVTAMAYRTCGAVAAAVFLLVFACPEYSGLMGNYNWVCPYTHEVTHGVALAMAAVVAISSRRKGSTYFAGVALGLCFLTKAEIFVPTAIAVLAGVWPLAAFRKEPRTEGTPAVSGSTAQDRLLREYPRCAALSTNVRRSASVLVSAAIPVVIALSLLASYMPLSEAVRATLGSWPWVFNRRIAALAFYRKGLGIDDLPGNLSRMAVVAAAHGVAVAVVLLAGVGPKAIRWVAVGVAAILAVLMWVNGRWVLEAARPWPVIVGLLAVRRARAGWKTPAKRGANGTVMAVLAAGLLGKMAFNARVWHYGFALAAPAAMVLVDGFVRRFPTWVGERKGNPNSARAAALVLLGGVVGGLLIDQRPPSDKSVHVGTGPDGFWTDRRGAEIEACRRSLAPGSLVVLPQGLMLNYLDRRVDPIRVTTVMPPEVLTAGEESIVADLDRHPPDVIILTESSIADGALTFEDDYSYGRSIVKWVKDHYDRRTTADPRSTLRLSIWTRRGS